MKHLSRSMTARFEFKITLPGDFRRACASRTGAVPSDRVHQPHAFVNSHRSRSRAY
jgi:hypothetical protein